MSSPALNTLSEQAMHLSPLKKVRLGERLMSSVERDLADDVPRRNLYGVWSDV